MTTRDFLEDALDEARRERDEALAQNWKYVLQVADMAKQIEDLETANRDLEIEVDWLRDRLSEKPYS